MRNIDIRLNQSGFGEVIVDGQKLHGVQIVSVYCRAGEPPKVTLRLAPEAINIMTEAELRVVETGK